MNNYKMILVLTILTTINNIYALSSTDESFLKNMVGKKELSKQQIDRIQKLMGDPKAAKIIEQITAKSPVVTAQLGKKESTVTEKEQKKIELKSDLIYVENALNVDDFVARTEIKPSVFYQNNELQYDWFDALALLAKKENPTISAEFLRKILTENAIKLMRLIRKTPKNGTLNTDDLNAIAKVIEKTISTRIPLWLPEPTAKTKDQQLKPLPPIPVKASPPSPQAPSPKPIEKSTAIKTPPVVIKTAPKTLTQTPKQKMLVTPMIKQNPELLVEEIPVMTLEAMEKKLATMEAMAAELHIEELKEKFAAMEAELYYDKKTGLITKDGIKNIIETVKSTVPSISYENLITDTYYEAAQLLKRIKKQTTLNQKTKSQLMDLINNETKQYRITTVKLAPQELAQAKLKQQQALPLEPIERRATIGSVPTALPVVMGALKELETIPMQEYHYEKMPTSFATTLPQPLSPMIEKFIDNSKKKGITAKDINTTWLRDAVMYIINGGMLTNANYNDTLQKLFEIADAVVGVNLRNDQTITDEEYANITASIEQRIKNFMTKLHVDTVYGPPR